MTTRYYPNRFLLPAIIMGLVLSAARITRADTAQAPSIGGATSAVAAKGDGSHLVWLRIIVFTDCGSRKMANAAFQPLGFGLL